MHGTEAAEREPGYAAQEFGIVELNRNENADEGEHGEPHKCPPRPGFDERFIDQLYIGRRYPISTHLSVFIKCERHAGTCHSSTLCPAVH